MGDACDQREISCERLTGAADSPEDEASDEGYKGGGSDQCPVSFMRMGEFYLNCCDPAMMRTIRRNYPIVLSPSGLR